MTAVHEVYVVKFGEHPDGSRGEYYHGSAAEPRDEQMQLNYYVWLIRSPDQDIVVDAGFTPETAERRKRTVYRSPSESLRMLDVDPSSVPYVVLSHFHYDHIGDVDAFDNARFVVQEKEMAFWTGKYASRREFRRLVERDDVERLVRLGLDGRVAFTDGEREIVPGVRVHHVGGHTAGLQVTSVETERGTVVLAADATHLYGNVENDAPFGIFTSLPGMYDTFDTLHSLASTPELIVPGHDPDVLKRFDLVDGLDGLVARVA